MYIYFNNVLLCKKGATEIKCIIIIIIIRPCSVHCTLRTDGPSAPLQLFCFLALCSHPALAHINSSSSLFSELPNFIHTTQHKHCSRWPDPQSQAPATNAKLRNELDCYIFIYKAIICK